MTGTLGENPELGVSVSATEDVEDVPAEEMTGAKVRRHDTGTA